MNQDDGDHQDEFLIPLLFAALWKGRGIIAACVLCCIALVVLYLAFIARPLYRADAIIAPVSAGPSIGGPRGALAAVAGISLDDSHSTDFNQFLLVMHSASLAEQLSDKYELDRTLFSGWDREKGQWTPPGGPIAEIIADLKAMFGAPPWSPPSPTRFAAYLERAITVTPMSMTGPSLLKSQIYYVTFFYKDRKDAEEILSLVLRETDALMRNRQMMTTQNRIQYLQDQLRETQEVPLRDGLQTLLTNEQQTLMSERADQYYSVNILDPPHSDSTPASPRRLMDLMIACAVGGLAGVGFVLYLLWRRIERATNGYGKIFDRPFPDPFSYFFKRLRALLTRTPLRRYAK